MRNNAWVPALNRHFSPNTQDTADAQMASATETEETQNLENQTGIRFEIEPSFPESHFVNAPARGRTLRTVNAIRLLTRLMVGDVEVATVNSAIYVDESGDPAASAPSARVFRFASPFLAEWRETVNEVVTGWDGYGKAYADAMAQFAPATATKKANGKAGPKLVRPDAIKG